MSGGFFDYDQYRIDRIADDIEHIIENNFVERQPSDVERWQRDDNGKVLEEYKYYSTYNDDTVSLFKDAVRQLRLAAIYAQRVDWLLSCDDSEDSFKKRLIEDIAEEKARRLAVATETKTSTLDDRQLSLEFE